MTPSLPSHRVNRVHRSFIRRSPFSSTVSDERSCCVRPQPPSPGAATPHVVDRAESDTRYVLRRHLAAVHSRPSRRGSSHRQRDPGANSSPRTSMAGTRTTGDPHRVRECPHLGDADRGDERAPRTRPTGAAARHPCALAGTTAASYQSGRSSHMPPSLRRHVHEHDHRRRRARSRRRETGQQMTGSAREDPRDPRKRSTTCPNRSMSGRTAAAEAGTEQPRGLERFAGWCYDHRRLVLLLWVIAIVGFSIAGQAAGGALQKTFDLPGSDAAKAFHILGQDFDRPGDTGQLVWKVNDGASPTSPEVLAVVQPVLDELAQQPHVAAVATPFDDNPGAQRFVSTTAAHRLRRDPVRPAGQRRQHRRSRRHAVHRQGRQQRHGAVRARRADVRRADHAGERGDRHPGRGRDPPRRLRFAPGHGPADHHRARRHQHRTGDRRVVRPRLRRALVRATGHGHDRHRGRHRLRAVHRDPLSGRAPRRTDPTRCGRPLHQHLGSRRALRRLHRRHLAARPVRGRPQLHPGDGHRRRRGRAHRDAGVGHAPPRRPRVRRRDHRQVVALPHAKKSDRPPATACGSGGPAPCSVGPGRRPGRARHPPRARRPRDLAAPGRRRRRQRPHQPDDPSLLRPARRGLRSREQRAPARRGRVRRRRAAGRHRPARRRPGRRTRGASR